MNLIRNWLAGVVRQLDEAAEGRIARAVACPDCHHGVTLTATEREDQAAGCECLNEDCGCTS